MAKAKKVPYSKDNPFMRRAVDRMRWAWARARAAHLTSYTEGSENPYERFAPGPKWDGKLWEACLLAKEAGLIPDEWVERRFYFWKKMQVSPTPQHLTSRSLLDLPPGYFEQRVRRERVRLGSYEQVFHRQQVLLRNTTAWGERDVCHHILSDRTLEFSDLFRYCLADRLKIAAVTVEYQDRALEEYLTRLSIIERVWSQYLPALFVCAASRIRDHISSLEIFV